MYLQLNSRTWSFRVLGCQFCPFKSFELMVSCPSYYVAKLGHLRILSLELFLCHNPAICGKSNLLDWLWLILVYFLVISCLVCLGIPPILCCASLKACEELQLGNRVLKKSCWVVTWIQVTPKRTNVPGMKAFRGGRFNPYYGYPARRPYPPPYGYAPYGYGWVSPMDFHFWHILLHISFPNFCFLCLFPGCLMLQWSGSSDAIITCLLATDWLLYLHVPGD
jgi:hypothetical protein